MNTSQITLQESADRHGVEFKDNGCIEWLGHIAGRGYGYFYHPYIGPRGTRRIVKAHRYAYEHFVGPIPDGMHIDHVCGNRRCVNPEHLRPVTNKQNHENLSGAYRSNKSTGVRGVTYVAKQGKYLARVTHNYKSIHVGSYSTIEEAAAAAAGKRNELFTHNDADRNEVTHGTWWGVAF